MTMARIDGGPAAVSWGPDRIDLFERTAERRPRPSDVRRRRAGRRVEDLGGTLASAPAVTAWAVDRMEVFAIFADGQLWDRYWDGASVAPVGVARRRARPDRRLRRIVVGPDRLDVFASGRDDRIWHRWWDGTPLGRLGAARISVAEPPGGRVRSTPAAPVDAPGAAAA